MEDIFFWGDLDAFVSTSKFQVKFCWGGVFKYKDQICKAFLSVG
jgi:hypothetical protein